MVTQCLIKNRIVFLGLEGYNYTHIKIKGHGIIITELSRKDALNLIKDQKLNLINQEEYDKTLGKIYTDDKFKDYVNKHPVIKNNLLFLLEQLDYGKN